MHHPLHAASTATGGSHGRSVAVSFGPAPHGRASPVPSHAAQLAVAAASDPVAGGSDGGVPAHAAAAVALASRHGPLGASPHVGGPDAPGHTGGTSRNPAAHEGAPGGKPLIVVAHMGLPSPATSSIVISHAAGDPWDPVTQTGRPEAGGPAVRSHRASNPRRSPRRATRTTRGRPPPRAGSSRIGASSRDRHGRHAAQEVVRGPSGAPVLSHGPSCGPWRAGWRSSRRHPQQHGPAASHVAAPPALSPVRCRL